MDAVRSKGEVVISVRGIVIVVAAHLSRFTVLFLGAAIAVHTSCFISALSFVRLCLGEAFVLFWTVPSNSALLRRKEAQLPLKN